MLFAVGQTIAVLIVGAVVGGLGRALDSGPLEAWFVEAVQHDAGRPLASNLAARQDRRGRGSGVRSADRWGAGRVGAEHHRRRHHRAVTSLSGQFGDLSLDDRRRRHVGRDIERPTQRTTQRTNVRATVSTVPATVSTGLRLIAGQPTLRRVTVLIASVGVALATVELLTPLALAGLLGGQHHAAGPYAAVLTLGFFGSAAGSALAPTATRVLRSANRVIRATHVLATIRSSDSPRQASPSPPPGRFAFYTLDGVTRPLVSDLTHRNVPTARAPRSCPVPVPDPPTRRRARHRRHRSGRTTHLDDACRRHRCRHTRFGAIVATRSVAEPTAAATPLQPHASDNPSQGDDYERPDGPGAAPRVDWVAWSVC